MIPEAQKQQMAEAVAKIRETMAAAAKAAGRDPAEVRLCAACKTRTVEEVRYSADLPIDLFGENHVQELVEKIDANAYNDKPGHFIGHLQTNKVKYVVGRAGLIHSVDSLHLAEAIEKECEKKDVHANILVEVNVAGEDSKFGIKPEETESLIRQIAKLPRVHVRGLMTIAPFVEKPEENRPIFHKLHKLLVDISAKNIDNIDMNVLSMGMTNDYEIAVEEGATHVRVGTGIFGERNYAV